ncbi:MAG: L-seryl-tRNA(Sec) selenium transferase [Pseudohongiella sp.]|nr:MAG: L-seryl-tRNA(Sec) selenium transferase [Pseudohongiella sp.]
MANRPVVDLLREIPSIDKMLQVNLLLQISNKYGRQSVKETARHQIELLRQRLLEKEEAAMKWMASPDFFEAFCLEVATIVESQFASSLVPVFNLTGTVVHTNLGRASLPVEAVDAMVTAATHATNLEYDLSSGRRGDRDSHLERAICDLTGAEAATVVNNNAAAVLLVLNTLAMNQEVIISRGELVEIGGAFRIPDVMESAHCKLREVGTTNRTHLRDYAAAINVDTGLLMKVHTSNYEIRGFTNSVTESELSELAKEKGIPFVSDLGSGSLVDLRQFGLPYEPTVKETLDWGADLVTFSGDKLLGGPQAGIIVGRRDLIERVKSNPLKRALRVDKTTLAALLSVINIYKDPQRLDVRLPILADLARPLAEIEELASRVVSRVGESLAGRANVSVQACKSQIGSGALPLDLMESRALCITPIAEKGKTDETLQGLSAAFRGLPKPVIGRVSDGQLLFDLRCLRDEAEFLDQLAALAV